jgi:hypothetical protein
VLLLYYPKLIQKTFFGIASRVSLMAFVGRSQAKTSPTHISKLKIPFTHFIEMRRAKIKSLETCHNAA